MLEPVQPSEQDSKFMKDRLETIGWLYQWFSYAPFRADRGFGQVVVFKPEGQKPLVRLRARNPTLSTGEKTHVFYGSATGRRVEAIRVPVRVSYARSDPTKYSLPDFDTSEWQFRTPKIVARVIEALATAVVFVVYWWLIGALLYGILPSYLGSRTPPSPPLIRRFNEWMKES